MTGLIGSAMSGSGAAYDAGAFIGQALVYVGVPVVVVLLVGLVHWIAAGRRATFLHSLTRPLTLVAGILTFVGLVGISLMPVTWASSAGDVTALALIYLGIPALVFLLAGLVHWIASGRRAKYRSSLTRPIVLAFGIFALVGWLVVRQFIL